MVEQTQERVIEWGGRRMGRSDRGEKRSVGGGMSSQERMGRSERGGRRSERGGRRIRGLLILNIHS